MSDATDFEALYLEQKERADAYQRLAVQQHRIMDSALKRLMIWSRDMWTAAHAGVVVEWHAITRELRAAGEARIPLIEHFDEEAPCTGLTARWCPVCGDCTCPEESSDLCTPGCPLHDQGSAHPIQGSTFD